MMNKKTTREHLQCSRETKKNETIITYKAKTQVIIT